MNFEYKITLKNGVKIEDLDPYLRQALGPLAWLWMRLFPQDPDGLTITSGHEGEVDDGIHKPTSLHYPDNSPSGLGRAVDLRVWDVGGILHAADFVRTAKIYFGTDFDVVMEKDHIHFEYDPKKTLPIV